jgi:adenine-specific DNA methylase
MNDPELKWQKLVEAARRADLPPKEIQPVPPGFSSRVLALRESVIALARVLFWRRWSITVAVTCFVIFVVIFAFYRCSESKAPLIETPDLLQPIP